MKKEELLKFKESIIAYSALFGVGVSSLTGCSNKPDEAVTVIDYRKYEQDYVTISKYDECPTEKEFDAGEHVFYVSVGAGFPGDGSLDFNVPDGYEVRDIAGSYYKGLYQFTITFSNTEPVLVKPVYRSFKGSSIDDYYDYSQPGVVIEKANTLK